MEFILNSKFFSSFSVEDLGYKVLDFGYDGIDINPGQTGCIVVSNVKFV